MIVERPALERRVLASLDAARIPVILGGCGAGRTSLLLRLEHLLGDGGQYLDFAAAASTPERCLNAVRAAIRQPSSTASAGSTKSPRAAFDALTTLMDRASTDEQPATFLIDEFLEIQTFENFPGLRHVQRELVTRLAASRSRFVLASRFTSRVHRLLRDAPARFEVIHVPPMDAHDIDATALRFDRANPESPAAVAAVAAFTSGLAGPVVLLLEAMWPFGGSVDPVGALVDLFAPAGRLTARCRETYERRLSNARGYGALKAILGILADEELLNLTEIAHRLQRTPGSTKDYLSWLEDVDLVTMQRKRYAFDDPLLRLYLRLYGRAVPPSDDDIVREVRLYAQARMPRATEPVSEPVMVTTTTTASHVATEAGEHASSGIIEID